MGEKDPALDESAEKRLKECLNCELLGLDFEGTGEVLRTRVLINTFVFCHKQQIN